MNKDAPSAPGAPSNATAAPHAPPHDAAPHARPLDTAPPARQRHDLARNELRRTLCARRAALDATTLARCATALADRLADTLHGARRVAGYLAIRGEMPLDATLARCRASGIETLVPRVQAQSLIFHRVDDCTTMRRGAFGIAEPDPDAASAAIVDPLSCDVVLMPLVAFDDAGNRLGMGGGYYDRTFATLATRRAQGEPTPRLVGIGHDFQRVDALPVEPWDVPLDRVVTEAGVYELGQDRNSR